MDIGRKRSGSRDLGAQLFCSMLRSIGLDVRLVCSLQPLPLQAALKPVTPSKPVPTVIPFCDTRTGLSSDEMSIKAEETFKSGPNSTPQGVRRFGHTPGIVNNQRQSAVASVTTGKRVVRLINDSLSNPCSIEEETIPRITFPCLLDRSIQYCGSEMDSRGSFGIEAD